MKSNITYALLANIVTAGLGWVLLLFLIRTGNSEDIGIYSLAQAIALPVHLFFTLKLRTIQLSDVNKDYSNSDYFNTRIILGIISFIITVLIAVVLYRDNYKNIFAISMLGLGYSAVLVREYFISIYQANEKNQYFFFSNIVFGVVSLVAFLITYMFTKNIYIAIIAYSLGRIFSIITDILIINTRFQENIKSYFKEFNKKNIKSLIRVGLPLGITATIGSLFTSIPRIKLESTYDLETLGIFTTLMSIVVFFNLFMSSFSQALIPGLTKTYHHSSIKIIKELSVFFFLLLISLLFPLLITYYYSEFILNLLFGFKYIRYSNEFLIAILAGCILSVFHFTNLMLNIQRNFKSQIYIYSLSALACLLASYVLIPLYGLKGAIYASISCSLIGIFTSIIVFFIEFQRFKSVKKN